MKICLASDLHQDIGQQPLIKWPEADVLVVAGDTANSLGEVVKFFDKLQRKSSYQHILTVDGNHENYSNAPTGRTVADTRQRLLELLPEGVTFLPAHAFVKIGDLHFVGRNGWYSFDYAGDPIANRAIWREEMNDCKWIGFDKLLQPPPWELAEQDARDIHDIIAGIVAEDGKAKIVVVTHTAPHRDLVNSDPRFLRTNAFYVNTRMQQVLEDFGSNIILWQYGHTHFRTEKMINGVYCIANPRGYPSENPSWEPVVIDL